MKKERTQKHTIKKGKLNKNNKKEKINRTVAMASYSYGPN